MMYRSAIWGMMSASPNDICFADFFKQSLKMVGPSGLEPPTSCLSGTRSNHLSYEPIFKHFFLKDRFLSDELLWSVMIASQVISSLREGWTLLSSWWRWWDSNPWPPACRAGALPAELHPHILPSAVISAPQVKSLRGDIASRWYIASQC